MKFGSFQNSFIFTIIKLLLSPAIIQIINQTSFVNEKSHYQNIPLHHSIPLLPHFLKFHYHNLHHHPPHHHLYVPN